MIVIQGKGVSTGVSSGRLYFYKRLNKNIERLPGDSFEVEKTRFEEAQKASLDELWHLIEECRRAEGAESASLFESHMMIVMDPVFTETVLKLIRTEKCTAEYAVNAAGTEITKSLLDSEDLFIQERIMDITDVIERVQRNLMGVEEKDLTLDEPVILAADELTPSETIRLDRSKLLGFVTKEGSYNCHTAILARILGIPAICGIGKHLSEAYDGRYVFLDGNFGRILIDPDEDTLDSLKQRMAHQENNKKGLEELKGQEDVTLDGKHIRLYCNIASPEEVREVLAYDGHGIGLYRSEFTYLRASSYPTEEDLFQEYKKVVSAMDGKTVIIRTLDVGSDKTAPYLNLRKEENPAMGLRGIRIGLTKKKILKTQLRAIYRASAFGKIGIMFPMIVSSWEVRTCRSICDEVMNELSQEGIEFDHHVEIGVMIETPSAVLLAGELATMVDFFSIGTNDLSQFILACDRQSNDLDRFFDPHHPSVMRAISLVMWAAHEHGIWAGICGELAGDLEMIPKLLAMGVDEFSVVASNVLEVRNIIRSSYSERTKR